MVITFRHDGRYISIRADRIKSVERVGSDTVLRMVDGDEYDLPEFDQYVHDRVVSDWNAKLRENRLAESIEKFAEVLRWKR